MEQSSQSDNAAEAGLNRSSNEDIQDSNKSLKRKSEHYCQTQNRQVYDLVKKNAERLNTIEDVMMKLNQILPGPLQEPAISRMTRDSGSKLRHFSTGKRSSGASQSSSTQSYMTSKSSPLPLDYVTQVNGVGEEDWEETTEDDTMTSPIVDDKQEDTTIAMVKMKQEWASGISRGGEDSSGRGCWLGDASNVDRRVWFAGDPNIIARCEKYGTNPVRLALSLTEAMFSREEMAASNVRGTRGKKLLDPERIRAIREHIDFKFPLGDDRMDVRWQLIKPKLDSKCRSQRRIQREQKWKFERMPEKAPVTPRIKKRIINMEERESLLYGGPKHSTPLNQPNSPVVSVYTESTAQFSET